MIEKILSNQIALVLKKLFGHNEYDVQFQKTRKEFDGDITLVVFPFTKFSKTGPEETAKKIGDELISLSEIKNFNVVKGFLNIEIEDLFWLSQLDQILNQQDYGFISINKNSPTYLVEYCSPNTNKPIHLGHIRNNLLGFSVAEILKASGKNVKKVQIINDRGIHICKSMVAWQEFGNGETPESTGIKGDHFVGKYYVLFDKQYKKEIAELIDKGIDSKLAEEKAPILLKAKEMLIRWEKKEKSVIDLWKKMNSWVYDGFEKTYNRLGVDFDKNYYESETYLLGKDVVKNGLNSGVFYKKDDGSVWIDLTEDGLDEKIILRSDGTAVYMTQDIGTAIQRHEDFDFSNMIYTVANEQDYHFKVLFLILEKLGYSWAKSCHHLSYGMVDLPSGKMKSREGTVVDADDIMQDMNQNAKSIAKELGKIDIENNKESEELYENIGMGALKYFMLKVDPKKRMLFDPKESIDFNGNTGPFIQYTYARIMSILRKNKHKIVVNNQLCINQKEKELIKNILEFPKIVQESANSFSPAIIANYVFDLVKEFNSYYQSTTILGADTDDVISFRVALSKKVSDNIKSAMFLLGINVPKRM
tara:strand:- start:12949 stop:14715 length:1767 start_codon:yes stop_codon:yes gene_type:complete